MDAVRVLVASDLVLYREGLQRILRERPELEALDQTGVPQLRDRLPLDLPAVVVLVLPPGPDAGPQLAAVDRTLREEAPETALVVVSLGSDGLVRSLLESRRRGVSFLVDDSLVDADVLVRAVLDAASGMVSLASGAAETLLGRGRLGIERLTPRELDVLAELSRGLSNRGIGESLHLSVRAVEAHVSSIFRKLDLSGDLTQDRRTTAALAFLHRTF
ncbi:MAG TPA: response regulator transcription factor [Candidatus Angelobacter sp.]|nr:response regulator transcription factor [Candidatus Angelobacter sp.]